jgi:hypothetical protein
VPDGLRRFLLTWRDGQDPPTLHDVACLTYDGEYSFHYLAGAKTAPGFHPLAGLPDFAGRYGPTPELFPAISGRLMDQARPDFKAYAAALDLPGDIGELDLLARSGGVSRGDTLVLTEEPQVSATGATDYVFIVRGLRYALPDPTERDDVLSRLAVGAPLRSADEPRNQVSGKALRLTTESGAPVGWVPDALTSYVRLVLEASGRLQIQRINGPDQPAHARLLARLEGELPPNTITMPPLGPRAHASHAA